MLLAAGLEERTTAFLLSDMQIVKEVPRGLLESRHSMDTIIIASSESLWQSAIAAVWEWWWSILLSPLLVLPLFIVCIMHFCL